MTRKLSIFFLTLRHHSQAVVLPYLNLLTIQGLTPILFFDFKVLEDEPTFAIDGVDNYYRIIICYRNCNKVDLKTVSLILDDKMLN